MLHFPLYIVFPQQTAMIEKIKELNVIIFLPPNRKNANPDPRA